MPSWLKRCWVVPAYVALTLLMTYPLVLRLGSHYVGTGGDLFIFPWNDWWLRKCLLEGGNPYLTNWLFYPQGVSLVYHNFAWVNTALWLPLSPLIGPIAASNVIFLFNIALGGIAMYALARYLTNDPRAAFIAGVVCAFWPCRMSHYNHPNMVSIGWVSLFLLFFIRTIREPRKLKSALLAGLFLALAALARWLHLIFAGGFVLGYLVYSLIAERRCWNRSTILSLVLLFGLALLLIAPLLFPLMWVQIRGGASAQDVVDTELDTYSLDLISYFVPDRSHLLFQPWLSNLWAETRRGAYLGYSVLLLAVLGLLKGRRERWLWASLGAGLFVLGLGPTLLIAGRQTGITLPYAWVQNWAPVEVIRHPNRFGVYLSLPVALLAAYGVAWLTARIRRRWALVAVVCALILFEYLPLPYPTVQPPVPAFYGELAEEPGDFAVLDLPLGSRSVDKLYMYYATLHGKRLVEGHVSRMPMAAYDFIDSIPLLAGLRQAGGVVPPALGDISRQFSLLADANIRYVILHPDLASPEAADDWRTWLMLKPIYEDQDTLVYRTRPEYGREFEFLGDLGDGIGVIGALNTTGVQPVPAPGGELAVDAAWGTRSAPQRDWLARLALVSPDGTDAQRADSEPYPGWPTQEWGANAVARHTLLLGVDPFLESGVYTLTLALVDPATGSRYGQSFEVGRVQVQALEREFTLPTPQVPVEALLGDRLRLLGYDLREEDNALHLTLHWQAIDRMAVAYKFFVHLVASGTGEIVAQADVMPRNWTYPTVWWERGEAVSDEITLAVAGVPPGRYRVQVGVYDPADGVRLLAVDPRQGEAGGAAQDHVNLVEGLELH